jgi:hypothetical protein
MEFLRDSYIKRKQNNNAHRHDNGIIEELNQAHRYYFKK